MSNGCSSLNLNCKSSCSPDAGLGKPLPIFNCFCSLVYGIPAAWGTRTKVVTWEHGNFFNDWGSRWIPRFRRFAARHSDAVVVLTRQDWENYLTHVSRCRPVQVIPNLAPSCQAAYDPGAKTILSAGLLTPLKGFARAIELAAKVLPSHPEWNWVICGEGPDRPRLEQLIADRGLQGRVLLPGTAADMEAQYHRAAMFVLTSDTEGLPMVLLEARACGLPILAFDIMTGPADLISDGKNGYLLPAFDLDAMAVRITALMDSADLRQQLSAHAGEGMDAYSPQAITAAWQELLERN